MIKGSAVPPLLPRKHRVLYFEKNEKKIYFLPYTYMFFLELAEQAEPVSIHAVFGVFKKRNQGGTRRNLPMVKPFLKKEKL